MKQMLPLLCAVVVPSCVVTDEVPADRTRETEQALKPGPPPMRLDGTYLISGVGFNSLYDFDSARETLERHAGLTGTLEANNGAAGISFYTNVVDTFGLTDGFMTTKTCEFVEGNPGPAHGRLLCQPENPNTKVILSVRYTIDRSGDHATAAGVLFTYNKTPDGIVISKVGALTLELTRDEM